MILGYARVSTDGQSVDAQVKALRAAGAEKIWREIAGPYRRGSSPRRCQRWSGLVESPRSPTINSTRRSTALGPKKKRSAKSRGVTTLAGGRFQGLAHTRE
jgi:hypothetical protein